MNIPNQDAKIRELAHSLWETRGRRSGHDLEDWLEAEAQVTGIPSVGAVRQSGAGKVDESAKQSFPASDPPASHLPDEPPRNCDDKWAAAEKARIVRTRKR